MKGIIMTESTLIRELLLIRHNAVDTRTILRLGTLIEDIIANGVTKDGD
jgi:hypothetical protein